MHGNRIMYIVVLAAMVSLAATGLAPAAADDAWLSETGETFLVGQPGLSDTEEAEDWGKTETQPGPEGWNESGTQPGPEGWNESGTQPGPEGWNESGTQPEEEEWNESEAQPGSEGWNETGTPSDPENLSLPGERVEAGDPDVDETQPIPIGGEEHEGKQNDRELARLLEMTDPCDLVEPEDLEYIMGTGIDPEIDLYVDAVEVILNCFPDDPGIMQLAACMSGKTEEAVMNALEAMRLDRDAVYGDIADAVRNAGLLDQVSEDRQADPFDNFNRTDGETGADPFDDENGNEEAQPFTRLDDPDENAEPFAEQTDPSGLENHDGSDGFAIDENNREDGGKTIEGQNSDGSVADGENPTDEGKTPDGENDDGFTTDGENDDGFTPDMDDDEEALPWQTDGTTDETTDEITDETTGETTDGTTDETTDERTDGMTDKTTDGTTDETTDGTTGETTDEITDGTTDETTDGTTDETTDGTTDGTTDETTGGTTDEITDGTTDETTDETTDGTTDETTDGTTDETTDGTTIETSENSVIFEADEEERESESILEYALSLFGEDVWADDEPDTFLDNQSGRAIEYRPADRLEDAVAFLSSFVLAEVTDGAGDFDDERLYTPVGEGFDWQGHDSNGKNGVVRSYDTISYILSYSAAYTDAYKYNTITGTKLYLEYSLPLSGDEAEFRLDAMPWFKGDGPDGRPVVYYTLADGLETTDPAQASLAVSQRVVGYRELPDTRVGDISFDIPGSGTVSCVVYVKNAALRQEIRPIFKGWLEAATDNTRAPGEESGIVRSSQPEEPVRVTLGAYVALRYLSDSFARTFTRHGMYPYYDGDFRQVTGEGRIKQIRYRITVGKPNGSIKGTSPLAPDRPVKVEFTLDAEATGGKMTTAGLYDLRTADMTVNGSAAAEYAWNGDANSLANIVSGEMPIVGMSPFGGCGSLDISSVSAEDGVYSFCIMPGGNIHPGDVFSGGDILLFSEQVDSDPDYSNLQYSVTIRTQTLYAVSALDETQSVVPFPQEYSVNGEEVYPFYDITNTLDGTTDTWHAHMYLGTAGQTGGMSGSGMYQTAGRIAYGEKFTLSVQQFFDINNENQTEKSRKLFILWDNNKVEMDVTDGKLSMADFWDGLSGGAPPDAASALLEGESGKKTRFVFLTKHDGSVWSDENEMDHVDLMSYDDLYMWQTYEEALRHGNICGLLVENYGYNFDVPTQNAALSLTFGMRIKEDPSLIGQSARFTCSIASYKSNVESTMGGPEGTGTLPVASLRKNWYLKAPRTYCKTQWDEQGRIIPSSLSANNHPHQGTSLYIEGYSMQVQSRILEDGIGSRAHEALMRDLMEKNEVTYRITPGFRSRNGVSGVNCRVIMPAPDDGNGSRVMHFLRLEALNSLGEAVELRTDGTVYDLSDFVDGAEGTFSVTEDDADRFLNGNEYTGNPLVGRDVVLRPSSDPSLALTCDGSASPVLRAYHEGDEAQIWRIMRHPAGGYGIVRKAGGEWLTGGKLVLSNLAAGQSMAFSNSMDRYDNRFTLTENGDGTWSLLIMGTRLGPGAVRTGSAETAVCLADADDAASLWTLTFSEKETDGLVIRMDGIADAYALPEFYAAYSYDKALVNMNSSITQNVYITENDPDIDPAADSHMASTGLGFIEINATVLMEMVDRPKISLSELRKGETITYTIIYTNIYNEDHAVDLRVPVPGCGDAAGSELAEGSRIRVTGVQVMAGDEDSITVSPLEEINRDGQLSVTGILQSGEAIMIYYSIAVQGAAAGNVIRNSCTQHDTFYTEQSNHVETLITGINDDAFVRKNVDTISNDISETQTWTIESSIPTGLTADEDVLYELRDEIDSEEKRLDYRGNLQVKLVTADGNSEDGPTTPMQSGTDYTVEEPESGTAGGTLKIRLTKAGLEKLCAMDARSGRLRVSYETSINPTAQAGVHIPNSVTLRYGMTGGGTDTPEPENPGQDSDVFEKENPKPDPYVYTGSISILKRDRKTMFPLPGVEFVLCDVHSAAVMQRDGGDFTATTGDDGRAVFHGLRDGTYMIMETRTDGNHELYARPLRVTVQDGRVPDESAVHVLNGSALKLNTGGGGVLPIIISGFLLMLLVPLYVKLS